MDKLKRILIEDDLELQELNERDIEDIFNTIDSQREYLGKWLPFVEHTKVLEDSRHAIEHIIAGSKKANEYVFTIRKRNAFIGLIGMKDTDYQNQRTEVGYWLSEKEQKQGIVTKSLRVLVEFIFNELNLNRIQIRCACKNFPSRAIPQRLAFKLEGIERDGELLRAGFTDIERYSILKREWLKSAKKTD